MNNINNKTNDKKQNTTLIDIMSFLKSKSGIVTIALSIVAIVGITLGSTFEKRKVLSRDEGNINKVEASVDSSLESANTITGNNLENSDKNNTVKKDSLSDSSSGYKDGNYTGQAKGFNGDIKVSVSISGGKISSIDILETTDDKEYLDRAKSVIDEVIKSQNTNVEAVSGATFSSNGILDATQKALDSGV